MQEFFPVEGKNFTRITDRPRQIMKEQGNVEAFEILELSNEVQCQHCHKYMSSGHVHRSCGRSPVHTIPKQVIVRKSSATSGRSLNCLRHLHSFSSEDQPDVESGVSRKIRKNEVTHSQLFTIRVEKMTHLFSTDRLETICTENLN